MSMSEQEKFYHEANEFIERNRLELQLGEAYAKFSFWRAVFGSKPGQIVFMLALLGLWYGEHALMKSQGGVIFLIAALAVLAVVLVLAVLAIISKILKFVYKCVRVLVGCVLGVVLVVAVLCNIPCTSLDLWMGKHFNR